MSIKEIILDSIDVAYPLLSATDRSLKASLMKHSKEEKKVHLALNNVSMKIKEGDRVCIIGHNGAGKSTLLKVISGIIPPTSGKLKIQGNVSPLLDFATGFEMEMTGYENIYIRGLLLGMSKREILAKRDEIVEFTGLGDFIHQPVKTYSSGMFVKLAFSIVTSIEPEILVIDEIVGAGDAVFAKKAQKRMLEMLEKGNIVIMATHSTELAIELCDKAIWFENGVIKEMGAVKNVIDNYIRDSESKQ